MTTDGVAFLHLISGFFQCAIIHSLLEAIGSWIGVNYLSMHSTTTGYAARLR